MSATGPDRIFRFLPPWRRRENGCRPGGWLCTANSGRPPAEPRWPPPPCATCRTLRQIPKGLPPAWSNTFEGPSGSGSGESMAWARKAGMKTGVVLAKGLFRLRRAAFPLPLEGRGQGWKTHNPSCRTPIRHPAGERPRVGRPTVPLVKESLTAPTRGGWIPDQVRDDRGRGLRRETLKDHGENGQCHSNPGSLSRSDRSSIAGASS